MSNSSLVNYTRISPNSSNPRNHKIDKITIHHMAGNLTVEQCGDIFSPSSRQASANYGIGSDGRVGLYVDEANRSWASASPSNDHRAVTIEVANDEIGGNWHVSDTAYNKLIELCIDICQRNGIAQLNYTGDASGNLTMHQFFAATTCPGPYLKSRFQDIANEVNARLRGEAYNPPAAQPNPDPAPVINTGTTAMPSVRYRAYTSNRWLPELVNHNDTSGSLDDYAGNMGSPITYLSIDMPGRYRVRTTRNGWLPWVYKYDPNDFVNGAAGDGSPITGIECYYETQNPAATGWIGIEYSAHVVGGGWLPNMIDDVDTGGSSDTFAGNGRTIDAFRARLVRR